MNTIAVVLRGHLRTWNFGKKSIFSTLESQYPNIDWYFVTWRESLSEKREQSLLKDFENKKLFLHIIEESSKSYNPWRGPGTLCMQVATQVQERNYSTVFETRPDVYMNAKVPFPEIDSNSFYTTSYNLNWGGPGEKHHFGSADWFIMSDSKVFYTYAWERTHGFDSAPHKGYLSVAKKHNINIMNLNLACKGIIAPPYRPIDVNLIRPSIFVPDTGGINLHGTTWMGWTKEKKLQVLHENDIAIADYDTGGCAAIDVEYGQ